MRTRTAALVATGTFVLGAIIAGAATAPDVETVTVTPVACLIALDVADDTFTLTGEVLGIAGDSSRAASDGINGILANDIAAIEDATARILAGNARLGVLRGELDPDTYRTNRDACRDAS